MHRSLLRARKEEWNWTENTQLFLLNSHKNDERDNKKNVRERLRVAHVIYSSCIGRSQNQYKNAYSVKLNE